MMISTEEPEIVDNNIKRNCVSTTAINRRRRKRKKELKKR